MSAARLVIWPWAAGVDLTRKRPVSRRGQKLTRSGQSMVRRIKVGSLENIEHPGPKLQLHALVNGEVLEQNKVTGPLGPKARHLNRYLNYPEGRMNQLAYWVKVGYLEGAPNPARVPRQAVWDDPRMGSLEARARAYLAVNCAHCHSPGGAAGTTGLYLSDLQTDAMRLGFCKTPVATGNGSANLFFDAVPGNSNESILVHRMASVEPKVMMPEVGRTVVDREGLQLVQEWLASLPGVVPI